MEINEDSLSGNPMFNDEVSKGGSDLSQIQLLTSKISHICQEICDIKNARKPKSNSLSKIYQYKFGRGAERSDEYSGAKQ